MGYFLSIFLGTFVLEDVALASSILLVANGHLSFVEAFLACFLGISIGDMGLYLIGYFILKLKLEARFPKIQNTRQKLMRLKKSGALTHAIWISRMLPGTRIPIYVGSGFLGYSFFKFFLLTLVSVAGWVLLALLAGHSFQVLLKDNLVLVIVGFFVFLHLVKTFVPKLSDKWERKALRHAWRKWTHFEFWPGTIFYLPIIPMYVWLSLKTRSFLTPFYVNPDILNGGLIGESKWDFLKHLDAQSPYTLPSYLIPEGTDLEGFKALLHEKQMTYPFILKPDVGQRGFAVRIVRNENELADYLKQSHFDLILQRLSVLPCEAGLMYIRRPKAEHGIVFSITDKLFPVVVGDGQTALGQLILNDPRARIIAPTYFTRFKDKDREGACSLDWVPGKGEEVRLSECGNHIQGAIFKNGNYLMTDALLRAVELALKDLPRFHFGRLDVRYRDHQALQNGEFEIVEINGAGAEATHIWDAQTGLFEAYATLYQQWKFLFEIGYAVKKDRAMGSNVHPWAFLKESAKVFFRKDSLSVSS